MDPTALLGHPMVQSAILPLVLAFVLTGVLRAAGGPGRGARLAAAGIGLALAVVLALVFGLPPVPPRSATDKLFLLTAGGLAVGFAFDVIRRDREIVIIIVVIAAIVAGLWWLAAGRLGAPRLNDDWILYGLVLAGGLLAMVRLEGRSGDGLFPAVMLLVAAVGAGAVTMIGASASLAQAMFGLAAATGGFMLWNWPVNRFIFSRSAMLGAGLPLFYMAAQAVFFTRASAPALALLILVFYVDWPARRIVRGNGRAAAALRPVVVGLLAAVPAAAAVGVALWLGGGSDDPYR